MSLAIGLYAKNQAKSLGEKVSNNFMSLLNVTSLEIGHYCYGGDDLRDKRGFKYEQDYFINGTEMKAVKKRFTEEMLSNGRLCLHIYFDYYKWPTYNESGEFVNQEIGHTKFIKKIFSGKQLSNRRRNQRRYSIDDLKSLGAKFESLGASGIPIFSHLVGYEARMQRIFASFQLEIQRFEDTNSSDFKNAIESALSGNNEQLKQDLNTLVPTEFKNDDGSPVFVPTHMGITQRL